MCNGHNQVANYVKQVGPPHKLYGCILKEAPEPADCSQISPMSTCLPFVGGPNPPCAPISTIIQLPLDPKTTNPNVTCGPCPPPPIAGFNIQHSCGQHRKSNAPQPCKAPCSKPPTEPKVIVCLPCPPPPFVGSCENKVQVCSFPFAVPQKVEGREAERPAFGGKYLPPPERRICPPNCLHVCDLKEKRKCTWWEGIPCIAHCFSTPLTKDS